LKENQVILLDRDGVINVNSSSYIKSVDELSLIEGSLKAISLLTEANFSIFVVSNQSAIGRGLTTLDNVVKIHREIDKAVIRKNGRINGYYFCPHRPDEVCECRKPKTGMLQKIENDHAIELKGSFFVGDALTDIELANKYGLKAILVRTGHGRETEKHVEKDSLVFENLLDAVQEFILIE
jgi:D-glycero-D-manno-heptose 1,7-bisphosphate phosphatase